MRFSRQASYANIVAALESVSDQSPGSLRLWGLNNGIAISPKESRRWVSLLARYFDGNTEFGWRSSHRQTPPVALRVLNRFAANQKGPEQEVFRSRQDTISWLKAEPD